MDTQVIDGKGMAKIRLRQATFLGMPTSRKELLRGSSSYQSVPSAHGARTLRVLESMDGKRTVADLVEVARAVAGPEVAPAPERLMEEVRETVERYGC